MKNAEEIVGRRKTEKTQERDRCILDSAEYVIILFLIGLGYLNNNYIVKSYKWKEVTT